MIRRVLLIHGIWNAKAWLGPLALRLRAAGFQPEVFGYPSIWGGPEVAVPRLVERLRRSEPTAMVGHSLGGLLALQALLQAPDLSVPRVVCLGSPLRGSVAARGLAQHAWAGSALGKSAALLQAGFTEWRGEAQVGMVAGNVARGLGLRFAEFAGPSDGTVALEETRLPGLADHCVVAASHSGLVFSGAVAGQVTHFLREGRFLRD